MAINRCEFLKPQQIPDPEELALPLHAFPVEVAHCGCGLEVTEGDEGPAKGKQRRADPLAQPPTAFL